MYPSMGKHTEWRKLAKKVRRKRIRQALAKSRHEKEEEERTRREQSPSYIKLLQEREETEKFQQEEEERLRKEAEQKWIQAEEKAQKEWRILQKKLEDAREERARQNALIKLEWEKEEQRLKELKEAKERERQEIERKQRLLQEELENFIVLGGDTPEHLKVETESNPNKALCPFFSKTSVCRFREACSRNHIRPGVSRVLLIPNFYSHYSLETGETEHGDCSLEFESDETYNHFKEFFFDVLPEMEQYGKIRQFKVCSNHEPHLRGNVYVEYSTTQGAVKGFQIFNGRWYGGKQLSVEFCNIKSWKAAICGLHLYNRCHKGNSCNFLHVFRNPNNLFHYADKDLHRTPEKRRRSVGRSEERREWRWSESPERLSLDTLGGSKEEKVNIGHKDKHKRKRRRSRSRSRRRKHRSRSRSRGSSRSESRREKRSKNHAKSEYG